VIIKDPFTLTSIEKPGETDGRTDGRSLTRNAALYYRRAA